MPRGAFRNGDYATYYDVGSGTNSAKDVLKLSFTPGVLTNKFLSDIVAFLSLSSSEPPVAAPAILCAPVGPVPPPQLPQPSMADFQAQMNSMASILQTHEGQLQASPATTPQTTPSKRSRRRNRGGPPPSVAFDLGGAAAAPSGPKPMRNPNSKAAAVKRNQVRAELCRIQQEQEEEEALEEAAEVEDVNRGDNIKSAVVNTLDNRYKVNNTLSKGGATIATLEALATHFGTKLAGIEALGSSKDVWPPPSRLSAPMRRAAVGHLVEVATDHFIVRLRADQDPSAIPGLIPKASALLDAKPCREESESE